MPADGWTTAPSSHVSFHHAVWAFPLPTAGFPLTSLRLQQRVLQAPQLGSTVSKINFAFPQRTVVPIAHRKSMPRRTWSSKDGMINRGIFNTFPVMPTSTFNDLTTSRAPTAHTVLTHEAVCRSRIDCGKHGLPTDLQGSDDSATFHDEGTPYCRVAGALAAGTPLTGAEATSGEVLNGLRGLPPGAGLVLGHLPAAPLEYRPRQKPTSRSIHEYLAGCTVEGDAIRCGPFLQKFYKL
ncbi:hypothetical protein ACLKA6_017220 [Drosophila palustris]